MINYVLFACLWLLPVTVFGQPVQIYQDHQLISQAITDYITHSINLEGEFEIELIPIDARLKLPVCSTELEVFMPIDAIKPGRNSIGVRCNGTGRWSIFTTALVKVYRQVLVLTQPLQRGDVLTGQQLSLERRDITKAYNDVVTQPEQILQKQAARQLPAGTLLSVRHFMEPKLIKRGERVVISAGKAEFSIKMNGLAMMDGIRGQRIRVKNESSSRIISATVIESGVVSVN